MLQNTAGSVTATHPVTVQLAPPLALTIAAPLTTEVGHSTMVQAQALPITTSLPLTYTWQATGQPTLTHTTSISDTVAYQWLTAGPVTITVQAANRAGAAFNRHTVVVIDERRFYLPLLQGP
jgi:hypothetical protein